MAAFRRMTKLVYPRAGDSERCYKAAFSQDDKVGYPRAGDSQANCFATGGLVTRCFGSYSFN
jgi:hypothetical protein